MYDKFSPITVVHCVH